MEPARSGLSRRVQGIAAALAPADRPDGELLAGWHRRRDQAAFAELVRRHGRLVWGVCRRATPDADDAYQAVFLLLARAAGRLAGHATVAPWLYGTAVRVARRANRAAARRRARERAAARPEAVAPPDPADWRPAFDAVLSGLPARYRDAVVLCELGGLPRAAAAARLGVPVGTLASRLAAARVLLRRRLARRGVTAGVLAAAGAPPAVTAGAASAAANQLARGVVAMVLLKKLLAGSAVVLVAAAVAGHAAPADGPAAGQPPAPAPPLPPAAPKPDPKAEALRLYNEGLALSKEGTYPQAIAKFTESIRLNPDFADVYFSRANAHAGPNDPNARDNAASVADLTTYLKLDPNEYGGRFNRAMRLDTLGRYDEAVADFTRLLDGPTDFSRHDGGGTPAGRDRMLASVRYYRGSAYHSKDDPGMAAADYAAAERLDPAMGTVRDGRFPQWYRGTCHRALKQYRQAVGAFEEGIRRDPEGKRPAKECAWLLATCPDAAVRNGKRAVELAEHARRVGGYGYGPPVPEVLAAAHAEAGDFKAAVEWQQTAVDKLGPKAAAADRAKAADRLAAYRAGKPWREE